MPAQLRYHDLAGVAGMQRRRGHLAVDNNELHAGASETAHDVKPAAIVSATDDDGGDERVGRGRGHGAIQGSSTAPRPVARNAASGGAPYSAHPTGSA